MKGTLVGVSVAAAVAILIAYLTEGSYLVSEGLTISWQTLMNALPMIIIAFILTGQIGVFLSKTDIGGVFKKFSGLKGIISGAIIGGLFPGGPYVFYPFISGFKGKAIPFYLFNSFIFGKIIYDVTRLPMEISLINPTVALIRNILTFPLPFIVGYLYYRIDSNLTTAGYFQKEES